MLEITPVFPGFAAEVSGCDLNRDLRDDEASVIRHAIDRYAVLVFRNQVFDDDAQIRFSQRLGELEELPQAPPEELGDRAFSRFIEDVSNLDEANRPFLPDDRRHIFSLGNGLWHSDSSLQPVPPSYSILSGRMVVERGGQTQFADMRVAYDTLDAEEKSLVASLSCEHSWANSLALLGITDLSERQLEGFRPVIQPLRRRHPSTGRHSLFLSSHIGNVVGWSRPESRAFLYDLTQHALRAGPIYSHAWTPDDLLIWDNRSVMHRVTRYDLSLPRDLRRTTVKGQPASA